MAGGPSTRCRPSPCRPRPSSFPCPSHAAPFTSTNSWLLYWGTDETKLIPPELLLVLKQFNAHGHTAPTLHHDIARTLVPTAYTGVSRGAPLPSTPPPLPFVPLNLLINPQHHSTLPTLSLPLHLPNKGLCTATYVRTAFIFSKPGHFYNVERDPSTNHWITLDGYTHRDLRPVPYYSPTSGLDPTNDPTLHPLPSDHGINRHIYSLSSLTPITQPPIISDQTTPLARVITTHGTPPPSPPRGGGGTTPTPTRNLFSPLASMTDPSDTSNTTEQDNDPTPTHTIAQPTSDTDTDSQRTPQQPSDASRKRRRKRTIHTPTASPSPIPLRRRPQRWPQLGLPQPNLADMWFDTYPEKDWRKEGDPEYRRLGKPRPLDPPPPTDTHPNGPSHRAST